MDEHLDHPHLDGLPRRAHPSRLVSDEELGREVKFGKWTPEAFLAFLPNLQPAVRYNLAYASQTVEDVWNALVAGEDSTYFLGDNEGVVTIYPLVPGDQGEAHCVIWGPRFFRRPRLGRAILRDACRRWNLRRLTAKCPGRHRALRKAIKSYGFTLEGKLREGVVDIHGVTDMEIWGILASELED